MKKTEFKPANTQFIEQLLHDYKVPIKKVIIGENAIDVVKEVVENLFNHCKVKIVCDFNTYEVAGRKLEKDFKSIALILKDPDIDIKTVHKIEKQIEDVDLVIAVGSGTINDLCKYASFLQKKPYIVIGTAPSMNGYSSANAAISFHGHKQSLKAHLPKVIIFDARIMAEAPIRLTRSGIGDSLCRSTAQADWLLSHLLFKTHYNKEPFAWLLPFENDLMHHAPDVLKGDVDAMTCLLNMLIISGLGMYICKGSYPASMGEHLIAHSMELLYGKPVQQSFHGEQIAVTTLTMAMLQESILNKSGDDFQTVKFYNDTYRKVLKAYLKKEQFKTCVAEYENKIEVLKRTVNRDRLDIFNNWNNICKEIGEVIVPHQQLFEIYTKIGLATTPGGIGWASAKYEVAVKFAKYIRNRITFLDLSF